MRQSKFKGCCAVRYIHYLNDMWFDPDLTSNNEIKKEKGVFNRNLQKILNQVKDDPWSNTQLVMMVLDSEQYSMFRGILNKNGFKTKQKFPGNDSPTLFLLTKVMQ